MKKFVILLILLLLIFISCEKKEKIKANENHNFEPGYLKLHKIGELKKRGEKLWAMMKNCTLCPRMCKAQRINGQKGLCQADSNLVVSSYHPHFGEEKPLVGQYGSGTIFFSNCSLRCVFCINWEISHLGIGNKTDIEKLADMMLKLQNKGCHNINLVTPTHYSPHILLALDIAARKGLRIPIVYNTSGYERLEILKLLDGVVDIYLPDFKYYDGNKAKKYSYGAYDYPEITKQALLEMHRQVGIAKPEKNGLIYKGLMIRHLIMPNNVSGSKDIMKWIAENLPKDTYINIMSQYRPMYKAFDFPEISRRINAKEYVEIVEYAKKLGLTNLDIQGY
ncbi:MAG: radical SAM protein [Candidatus Goldbacteria bacterium]|nr:radical SAM protein [Candidatus Goldiibacteriota bacterium]